MNDDTPLAERILEMLLTAKAFTGIVTAYTLHHRIATNDTSDHKWQDWIQTILMTARHVTVSELDVIGLAAVSATQAWLLTQIKELPEQVRQVAEQEAYAWIQTVMNRIAEETGDVPDTNPDSENVATVSTQEELPVTGDFCRVTVYTNENRVISRDALCRISDLPQGMQRCITEDSTRQPRYIFSDPLNPQNSTVQITAYDPDRCKEGQPPRIITLR